MELAAKSNSKNARQARWSRALFSLALRLPQFVRRPAQDPSLSRDFVGHFERARPSMPSHLGGAASRGASPCHRLRCTQSICALFWTSLRRCPSGLWFLFIRFLPFSGPCHAHHHIGVPCMRSLLLLTQHQPQRHWTHCSDCHTSSTQQYMVNLRLWCLAEDSPPRTHFHLPPSHLPHFPTLLHLPTPFPPPPSHATATPPELIHVPTTTRPLILPCPPASPPPTPQRQPCPRAFSSGHPPPQPFHLLALPWSFTSKSQPPSASDEMRNGLEKQSAL